MKKILLASAAIPVVFKPVQVGDTVYVDGGIYNNVPLKPLIDEKMDKILVIDLFKYNVRRKAFVDAIPIYHIHPHRYLGKVLDFNPIKAEENIRYGYQTVTDQLNDIKHFLALD
jgi:NTE family protein